MRHIWFLIPSVLLMLACTDNAFMLGASNDGLNYNPLFNSKVDILLVVDNSGSMDKHQSYLASSSQKLMQRLVELGFDFQIGVTSTDISSGGHKGKLIGSPAVITAHTPQAGSKLHERILLGVEGSNVEEGLEAAKMALTNESNLGFLREDAFLLFVVLSNENDGSTDSTQNYAKFFAQVKPALPGRERGWMLNFIGVTGAANEDCKTFGDYKSIGTRYMDLAAFTGGTTSTICTADLSAAVKGVEKALLTVLTEIVLSRQPNPETLRVYFNGQEIPNDAVNGWTYSSAKNSVLFHGTYIPKVQTKIDIVFDPVSPK